MGEAMFQIAGVFAELERSILKERIMAGIAGARDKGTKSGKPIIDYLTSRKRPRRSSAGNTTVRIARLPVNPPVLKIRYATDIAGLFIA
jgi:DNA invertase Pin-like site-specific DNA recombinase